MKIKIPNTFFNNKALFLVDIQPSTINGKCAREIQDLILKYLKKSKYDCYVIVAMDATEESMLFKQKMKGKFEIEEITPSNPQIEKILKSKKDEYISLVKESRSIFKSFQLKDLRLFLDKNKIQEIHFVGFDINDCVLASAYDALDLGYYSYVIEELSHNADGDKNLKNSALNILQSQKMTNNSINKNIEEEKFIEL